MPQYRAEWLLPISQPPIRDAWLRTDRGRIVAFGHSRPGDLTASDEFDLGNVAVLPALVNAHTHLELSWMRGRVPATDDFPTWLRAVLELRRSGSDKARVVEAAIAEAITNHLAKAREGDVAFLYYSGHVNQEFADAALYPT